jgi:guanine deaminase
MKKLLVKAKILNPLSVYKFEYIDNGFIIIKNGKIIDKGKLTEKILNKNVDCDIYDFSDKYMLPGFVDSHLHLPQIDQRAMYGESLLDWLQKYIYPAEMEFSKKEIALKKSERFFDETIKNGTTLVSAYSTFHYESTDIAFEVAAKKKVKAFIGKVMMDYSEPNSTKPFETLSESISNTMKLYEKWHNYDNGRLKYILTPRFAPACSFELMKKVGELARSYNLHIQTHLSENEDEIVNVIKRFDSVRNYTELYEKCGMLTDKTVLGHCLHLFDDEFQLLHEKKCSIAHCPSSNFFLKSGDFKLSRAEFFNIPISLGTDVGAGPSFSMFDVMKAMNYMQRYQIQPEKSFYYATLGGAKVLGLGNETGSIDIGKDADFIIIDIKKILNDFIFQGISNILGSMIYLGNDKIVTDVFVRGIKLK